MANTYGTFTGNGSTATYAIPFTNWLNDSHVIVRVAGVNYDITTTGTAYDFTVSNGNVVFNSNIASGVFFYILRDTLGKDHDDTALLYDFSDGSILTADQQDDVYRQNFYLAQEAAEQVPSFDTGWINTFDTTLGGNATLAASVNVDIRTGSDLRTILPLKQVTFMGQNSSESEIYWLALHQSATYDHSGSALTYGTGTYFEYKVVGSDYYFNLNLGEKASVSAVAFNGLAFNYLDWVSNVAKIRLTIS